MNHISKVLPNLVYDLEFLYHVADEESWVVIESEEFSAELLEDKRVVEVYEWQLAHVAKYGQVAPKDVLLDEFKDIELQLPQTAIGDLIERLRERYIRNEGRDSLRKIIDLHKEEPLAVPATLVREGKRLTNLTESRTNGNAGRLTCFSDIKRKDRKWLLKNRIALSKITSLSGRSKVGKGLFYTDLIAQTTRGDLLGDLDGPRDCIIVTSEDEAGEDLKPRLMAANADMARVHMFEMGSLKEPIPFRVPQDVVALTRKVKECNAALVVIDPLIEFIDDKHDTHKSQPLRQALSALRTIALDSGCAILVVYHLNKGTSNDPLLRQEAGGAFTQVVRSQLVIGYDPEDPDGERSLRRIVAHANTNNAALEPSFVHEIRKHDLIDEGVRFSEVALHPTEEESDLTAYDLLSPVSTDGEKNSALIEAVIFVATNLANGPQSTKDVNQWAAEAGISESTLRRAREKLGVTMVVDPEMEKGKAFAWITSENENTYPEFGGEMNKTDAKPNSRKGSSSVVQIEIHHGQEVARAVEFLRDELAEGPKSVSSVRKAAKAVAISHQTLRRAQEEAGIETSNPTKFGGSRMWSLPAPEDVPEDSSSLAQFEMNETDEPPGNTEDTSSVVHSTTKPRRRVLPVSDHDTPLRSNGNGSGHSDDDERVMDMIEDGIGEFKMANLRRGADHIREAILNGR
jgi:putative DNA primase/helicase